MYVIPIRVIPRCLRRARALLLAAAISAMAAGCVVAPAPGYYGYEGRSYYSGGYYRHDGSHHRDDDRDDYGRGSYWR